MSERGVHRSARRRLVPLLILFAGSLGACRSGLSADTLATLRAPNRTDYDRVAGELIELVPRVQATLGVWCGPVPHVVLLSRNLPGMTRAECIRGEHIRIGREVREDPHGERSTVAHELVHWFARGPWASLPLGVEEGLAQLVADELVPEYAAVERTSRAILLQLAARGDLGPIDVDRALENGPHGWEESPPLAAPLAGALGHAIVLRVGRERLRDLCQRARAEGHADLDLELLYAAAGVQRGSRWWVPVSGAQQTLPETGQETQLDRSRLELLAVLAQVDLAMVPGLPLLVQVGNLLGDLQVVGMPTAGDVGLVRGLAKMAAVLAEH